MKPELGKPAKPDPRERYRQKRKFDPGLGYTPEASDGGRDWPTIIITTSIAAVVIVALVLGAIAMVMAFAWAADIDNPGAWFKSLRQPDMPSVSCCDVADCHRTMSEWRADGWWAVIGDRWQHVPPEKVLKQPSIFEDAVVCNAPIPASTTRDATIFCFAPPPLGF